MSRVHIISALGQELSLLSYIPTLDLRLLKADRATEVLVDQKSIDCRVEKRRCKLAYRPTLAGSAVLCHIHCLIEMSNTTFNFGILILYLKLIIREN